MNTDPHNLMNPLREKFPYFIRHEKLYRMIHLQLMKKWFQYFVLFFIIGSICSIIYGSFEESAPYHNYLYTFNYLASFIFTITVGYGDIYPITPLGRLLSSIISLIGIAMIAIPTGIISSAFMNMLIEKKQKENNESTK